MNGASSSDLRAARFLRACRREPVDRTPIWLMRQAGRYMPEYRALRQRHGMLDLVRTPELAAQITLQPVDAFEIDAAIVFADILPILDGMGLGLEFVAGEGPHILRPVRAAADVDRIVVRPPEETLGFTLEAVRLARRALAGRVPLIGFSGAPFTLACYAIEGGSSPDFPLTRRFLREQPAAWAALMGKLAEAAGDYLAAQVRAGAQAVQMFDSWAGRLTADEYRAAVLPFSTEALRRATAGGDVPVIHFATQSAHLLPLLREAGGTVFGVGSDIAIDEAWRRLGDGVAVQGNLDPDTLLGPENEMQRQAKDILSRVAGRPGHIFNLAHGVKKETDPARVRALVGFVHGRAG
ncbi:MAG: uroporphyrinogen decarboxylase [Verrucomicrobia bacterium]|nr:uroporphyrinogen decarboxylase [Verrucomicrobiota bacterium]